MTTVWLFLILSTAPTGTHQAVDLFPTQEACQAFQVNVRQMMAMGLAADSRVTACVSRQIVPVR